MFHFILSHDVHTESPFNENKTHELSVLFFLRHYLTFYILMDYNENLILIAPLATCHETDLYVFVNNPCTKKGFLR